MDMAAAAKYRPVLARLLEAPVIAEARAVPGSPSVSALFDSLEMYGVDLTQGSTKIVPITDAALQALDGRGGRGIATMIGGMAATGADLQLRQPLRGVTLGLRDDAWALNGLLDS